MNQKQEEIVVAGTLGNKSPGPLDELIINTWTTFPDSELAFSSEFIYLKGIHLQTRDVKHKIEQLRLNKIM